MEKKLIARYTKAATAYNAAADAIAAYFMPLVSEAAARRDISEMEALRDRCPDHVTKCFTMDAIRQAKLT